MVIVSGLRGVPVGRLGDPITDAVGTVMEAAMRRMLVPVEAMLRSTGRDLIGEAMRQAKPVITQAITEAEAAGGRLTTGAEKMTSRVVLGVALLGAAGVAALLLVRARRSR